MQPDMYRSGDESALRPIATRSALAGEIFVASVPLLPPSTKTAWLFDAASTTQAWCQVLAEYPVVVEAMAPAPAYITNCTGSPATLPDASILQN